MRRPSLDGEPGARGFRFGGPLPPEAVRSTEGESDTGHLAQVPGVTVHPVENDDMGVLDDVSFANTNVMLHYSDSLSD